MIQDIGLAYFEQLHRFLRDTRLKSIGTRISAQELEESSMHPISSREEGDFQYSVKERGHLPTSTSRGAFPQQSVCERDPEFAASRAVDTEIP